MPTLEDLLKALERMGIETDEIKLSRDAYSYFIQEAEKIIDAEEELEDEQLKEISNDILIKRGNINLLMFHNRHLMDTATSLQADIGDSRRKIQKLVERRGNGYH